MANGKPIHILSIETSGTTCGVAITSESGIIAEFSLFIPNVHDSSLAELTRSVLLFSNLTLDDIDAVAVSSGPGSFTGLRIGVSFAKSLCIDENPKLIGVPTLTAFAGASDEFAKLQSADKILSVLSSQKGVYFAQEFTPQAEPISSIQLLDESSVHNLINSSTVVSGTSASLFGGLQLSGLNRLTPRFIARTAHRMYSKGLFEDALTFAPQYHQDFVVKQKVE
jgi:tRNA threonylcarbamoyladenosine biosynthesis protein TsaB